MSSCIWLALPQNVVKIYHYVTLRRIDKVLAATYRTYCHRRMMVRIRCLVTWSCFTVIISYRLIQQLFESLRISEDV